MNHPSKRVIRNQWCKPLLQFINEQLGCKLTYLGLPAEEAHDVRSWIDYIDYVIAFQCRKYPEPSSVEQPRDVIIKLEEKLLELERQGKLSSFTLYDGYIEEVLIKGKDTIGQEYVQDRTVTVYNLDFCNSVTTPIHYYDENRCECEAFKSDAIKRLMEWQRIASLRDGNSKFVMFLTVHSSFLDQEESRFTQQERALENYLLTVSQLTRGKKLRTLKAYVYHMVKSFFCNSEFSPEFLPVIYYKGSGYRNWLVHFTIVGVYNRNPSSIAPCLQSPNNFLKQKFLQVKNNHICSMHNRNISENDVCNDSVSVFRNTQLFQELWQ